MGSAVAVSVPARCPHGHVLDRRTAVITKSGVRCAICDRSDCYRAHHGTEPPPEVIAPDRFKPVGGGITAADRATYLSEMDTTDQHQDETTQEPTMSHSDPTSSAALREVNSARRRPAHGASRTTWRDYLDPYEVPRGDIERDEAEAMGLDAWQRQQAYVRWSHSRGDFGID